MHFRTNLSVVVDPHKQCNMMVIIHKKYKSIYRRNVLNVVLNWWPFCNTSRIVQIWRMKSKHLLRKGNNISQFVYVPTKICLQNFERTETVAGSIQSLTLFCNKLYFSYWIASCSPKSVGQGLITWSRPVAKI